MLRDPKVHIDRLCDTRETSPTARLGRLFCFSAVLTFRELSGSSQTEMLGGTAESHDWELASLITKYHAREELKDYISRMGYFTFDEASLFSWIALKKFGGGFEADFANMEAVDSVEQQQQEIASNKIHSSFTFRSYLHEMTTNGSILT